MWARTPYNRAGVYPQGETVTNLGLKILKEGVSLDEAQHAGVCVEEVPTNPSLSGFRDFRQTTRIAFAPETFEPAANRSHQLNTAQADPRGSELSQQISTPDS